MIKSSIMRWHSKFYDTRIVTHAWYSHHLPLNLSYTVHRRLREPNRVFPVGSPCLSIMISLIVEVPARLAEPWHIRLASIWQVLEELGVEKVAVMRD